MRKSVAKTARTIKRGSGAKTGRVNAVAVIRPLTARSLKETLWETLLDLRHDNILPNRADAIAAQAREIIRTVKTQLQVAGQSKRPVPDEITAFSESAVR
jgi:hypothetical protein